MILHFPLARVLAAAEHALRASSHRPFDSDATDDPPPALIWGKDQGTWICSNGLPVAAPVYAEHWGPTSVWHVSNTVLGGDDFTETFPSTRRPPRASR